MKSCAVIVRVFDGEAPYLQSFIDHHRSLGVETFFPVLPPGSAPLCRDILERNDIQFYESEGQKIGCVKDLIREDYVAVIDADEYLHPDLFQFLDEENAESLLMPWKLTASMEDDFFESAQKRFFVFPQGKSIVKTAALKQLRLHASVTSGSGRCLGIAQGQQFPVQHYYLRGLDDLLLKEGGLVNSTLGACSGRKPVKLNADCNSMEFSSRHARLAFLLKVLKSMPMQNDPYRMTLDRSMLKHLRNTVEGDLDVAKQVLRDKVLSIQRVYKKRTIQREINKIQEMLASNPRKVGYNKRVLKLLRRDFKFKRSRPKFSEKIFGISK